MQSYKYVRYDLDHVTKLIQHLHPSKKKNASGYKSLKLSVTAQRKEKKEAAKTNEEYPFLPVTSSHISCKMCVLFTNIQNSTVIFQNIC